MMPQGNYNQHQPMVVSNDPDDFIQSSLYPGGSGVVKSCRYELWDYDGNKPKDSFTALHVVMSPLDGSNDGKDVDIHIVAGSSSDFLPDPSSGGGRLLALTGKNAIGTGSNLGFFLSKLRDNCGLEKGRTNGPTGVAVLEQAYITVARVDQPARDFADAPTQPQGGAKKNVKATILVPVRLTATWDPNYARAAAQFRVPGVPAAAMTPAATNGAAMPPMAPAPAYNPAPAPAMYQPPAMNTGYAPMPGTAPVGPPAGPPPPPAQPGSLSAQSVLQSILQARGSINVADIGKLALEAMNSVDRNTRLPILTEIQAGYAEIALANNWKLNGGVLSL